MTNEDLTEDLKMLPIGMVEPNDGQLAHLGLKQNPRTMKKAKFEKLKQDIIEYPELLRHRRLLVFPMENGKYIIIGGNMRYRAMCELKHKEVPVSVLDKDTPIERLNAYIILDNSGFGEWDWDMLANEWEYDMLEQWGLDVPVVEEVLVDDEKDEAYTRKVDVPTYTPSDTIPTFAEMCDTAKRDELIEEINKSDVPDDVREFLIDAAYRHTVFNYEKIADFYASASAKVQDLMERSALVIIDFEKAIEGGFITLTKDLANAYRTERNITDEAELTESDIEIIDHDEE